MKKLEIPSWDQYFMTLAYLAAMRSKDDSTHIGAVIVGPDNEVRSMGYNNFVRGINDYEEERYERPEKYHWFEHGERNAIYNASRVGIRTDCCKMYTQLTPCTDCARAIIQSGITEVIIHDLLESRNAHADPDSPHQKWNAAAKRSRIMFKEAGVSIREYNGPIISQITGLVSGEKIEF